MTFSFLLALTFWCLGVLFALAIPGFYLAHKYDQAKEIRARNEMRKVESARLVRDFDNQTQALFDGNLLLGLYGAHPPADEFRPPPEECGPVKAKMSGAPAPCVVVDEGTLVQVPPTCCECKSVIPSGNICNDCYQDARRVRGYRAERGKPQNHRPQCKDCKRFVKRGQIRCPRCSPLSYLQKLNEWHDNLDGTIGLTTGTATTFGINDRIALAVARPTIDVPTHYDRVAQAPIPSMYRYWQEFGTRRDIL